MRTTVDIDTSVLIELKERAKAERKTLGRLISELLASTMRASPTPQPAFHWPSQKMGAKIDLEDKEAVWALLDEGHDLRR